MVKEQKSEQRIREKSSMDDLNFQKFWIFQYSRKTVRKSLWRIENKLGFIGRKLVNMTPDCETLKATVRYALLRRRRHGSNETS